MPTNDSPIDDGMTSPTPPPASNPLGNAIVPVLVVFVLLVGTWFFVIPLFKEVKNTSDKMRSIAKPIPAPTPAPGMPPPTWEPPK